MRDERAKHGYLALCPDFLSGSSPEGGATDSFAFSDAARTVIFQLEAEQITMDLEALVKYDRNLPATKQKVSVMGFCWGSAPTFRYATNDDSLAAASVFYGRPLETSAMSRINCPTLRFLRPK